MSVQLSYSQVAENTTTPILIKILNAIHQANKKNQEYQPVVGLYKNCLTQQEQNDFNEVLSKISYIVINKYDPVGKSTWPLQRKLNDYIDEELYLKRRSKQTEIDYFAFDPFKKIGNNNLDLKEDKVSAGLLYSL